MRWALLAVAMALLSACGTASAPPPAAAPSGPPPTAKISDQDLFKQARQAVTAAVRDPESAKFGPKFERRVHATRSGEPYEIVCGQVNAKNGFGGYTGMKMFAWTTRDSAVYVDDLVTSNLCLGTTGSKPSGT